MTKQRAPVKKNDEITLRIDALTPEGYGIGRVDGFAVFVPMALIGEEVLVHVIKLASHYAVAKLLEVIVPSPHRVEPDCGAFERCGGCSLKHLSYEEQLKVKRAQVQDALERIGGFNDVEVLPVIGMENPKRYRNKGSFPFAMVDGRVELGFFAPRSHRLVPLNDCAIEHHSVMKAALCVRDWAREHHVEAYDESTRQGILRHVMARVSTDGGVMAMVVTAGALPYVRELVDALRYALPSLVSVVHNINLKDTNVICGERYDTIWGEPFMSERILGLNFKVSAASFLQVNAAQTQKLYRLILEYLKLTGHETVADVYSGIGTISLLIARAAKRVIGIENVMEAVSDARLNMAENGIQNAEFICGQAELALPRIVASGAALDAIVVDPPRKGCEEEALRAIIQSRVPRLVYVSCNPATLARDCRILCDEGFTIQSVQPVDMFPHTAHVETVVLMSRTKN